VFRAVLRDRGGRSVPEETDVDEKEHLVAAMEREFHIVSTRPVPRNRGNVTFGCVSSTLNRMTEEILFEVYDCNPNGGNQFMGLAIVGVEELLVNPYQRQVLSLQSRPYQNDSVSGTLTLEVSERRLRKKLPPAIVKTNVRFVAIFETANVRSESNYIGAAGRPSLNVRRKNSIDYRTFLGDFPTCVSNLFRILSKYLCTNTGQ